MTDVRKVKAGMLVRRPQSEVFQAFADPAITTKFWYTKSSGKMVAGADLTWEWEMYGASARIAVKEVEPDSRIVFEWNDGMTVELRFEALPDGTYVDVTETGFGGTEDEVARHVGDSTGGFTIALCALKALLEHGVELGAVGDRFPKGLAGGH
ncbi:SRPBCC family protein [Pseudonocardia acaciae]|uniref:SRPBCC family protein n=1 Tax=Pseudonocardia acaciae TaxID=551276 RepID=UPI00049173DB|nr:SRPBCC family protein [Pseudonocardia acaciae]